MTMKFGISSDLSANFPTFLPENMSNSEKSFQALLRNIGITDPWTPSLRLLRHLPLSLKKRRKAARLLIAVRLNTGGSKASVKGVETGNNRARHCIGHSP